MLVPLPPSIPQVVALFNDICDRFKGVPITPEIAKLLNMQENEEIKHATGKMVNRSVEINVRAVREPESQDAKELIDGYKQCLWSLEEALYPHCLPREWKASKRARFKKRLVHCDTLCAMAYLLQEFDIHATTLLIDLADACASTGGVDKRTFKAKKGYIPEIGDTVSYVRSGHRSHLDQPTQPRRLWEVEATENTMDHVEVCVVDQIMAFRPLPLDIVVQRPQEGSKEADPVALAEPEYCNPFCCVKLQPKDSKAPPFQVTIYLNSRLPEFVVKHTVFEDSKAIAEQTRVKMWFANEEQKGGEWYQGTVVKDTRPESGDPWECMQVMWDGDNELTEVCPWELLIAEAPEAEK